jgi:ribose/xylose/arabinose/galactoside ABC-type transport system permease subunit
MSMAGVEMQALVAVLVAGLGWRTGRLSISACALAAINLALLAQGMQSLEVALGGIAPFDPDYAFYILLAPIALLALWLNRANASPSVARQAADPAGTE